MPDQYPSSDQSQKPGVPRRRAGPRSPSVNHSVGRREQILSDTDHSSADSDQTNADTDQTGSDSDQTSSENDQIAADRDQAASDRDLAAGIDPRDHEITRDIRQRTSRQRELTAHARLDAATQRDAIAHVRDLAALARDQAAEDRDRAMAQHDATYDAGRRADFGVEIIMRAAEQRSRAAAHRALAAEQRELAAADRAAAALDREQAAEERLRALADRETFAQELSLAAIDPLTGARTRAAGLIDLEHEIDRCRRTDSTLVIVYVDVVGLKALNDTQGHHVGDDLLRHVAGLFRANLRSYDLVLRLGGDEFLCAISNMSEAAVRQAFSVIAGELAATPDARGIRTGFATLRDSETPTDFIARADAELVRATRQDPAYRPPRTSTLPGPPRPDR